MEGTRPLPAAQSCRAWMRARGPGRAGFLRGPGILDFYVLSSSVGTEVKAFLRKPSVDNMLAGFVDEAMITDSEPHLVTHGGPFRTGVTLAAMLPG